MKILVDQSRMESGKKAAELGADLIRKALANRGEARVILATGSSQFDMLDALVAQKDIDWSKCRVFHLDEYIGLSHDHPASFVNYLSARFVSQVPDLGHFEAVQGKADDIDAEITRLNTAIGTAPIDVAFIGIGENGHLAFNDPPADFDTDRAYIQVSLDQPCRAQQVSEGWFKTMDDVPTDAITMTISQILKSSAIICTVSDTRKAQAVAGAVDGPISNLCPASALQKHDKTWLFLDEAAAADIKKSDAHADA